MMELHDKQIQMRFTVEKVVTTAMQANFTISMPAFAVRDIYDLNSTLAHLVENSATEKADWKPVGHTKTHITTVSCDEVK